MQSTIVRLNTAPQVNDLFAQQLDFCEDEARDTNLPRYPTSRLRDPLFAFFEARVES